MRESANNPKKSVWSLAKFAEMTKGGSLSADNFLPNRPSTAALTLPQDQTSYEIRTIREFVGEYLKSSDRR